MRSRQVKGLVRWSVVSRGRAYRFGVGRACSEHGCRSEDGRQRGLFSTQDKCEMVEIEIRCLARASTGAAAAARRCLVPGMVGLGECTVQEGRIKTGRIKRGTHARDIQNQIIELRESTLLFMRCRRDIYRILYVLYIYCTRVTAAYVLEYGAKPYASDRGHRMWMYGRTLF